MYASGLTHRICELAECMLVFGHTVCELAECTLAVWHREFLCLLNVR